MKKWDVVVVDDQPSICKEVANFLKDDCEVHAFKSGRDVLNYLEKNTTDLIFLDYYMPEMTGFEILLQIRQNKAISSTPVIFLTSETSDRMEHEMTQRGACGYLCKPVNAEQLKQCVRKHLAN